MSVCPPIYAHWSTSNSLMRQLNEVSESLFCSNHWLKSSECKTQTAITPGCRYFHTRWHEGSYCLPGGLDREFAKCEVQGTLDHKVQQEVAGMDKKAGSSQSLALLQPAIPPCRFLSWLGSWGCVSTRIQSPELFILSTVCSALYSFSHLKTLSATQGKLCMLLH